ncbi:MAG TPA: polysaccharide deacetylase family protein [Bryobacteraceae bacterium]|jgi:peptidoglycan/xylan/chitin deacetylase (PgdA/CDA1 family)|nr:polysaccharide deacetylase family protein [Bryobacteraceae bacterium]
MSGTKRIGASRRYLTRGPFAAALTALLFSLLPGLAPASGGSGFSVPILVYHKFSATASDSMTVSTQAFESELDIMQRGGYRVIPLSRLTDAILNRTGLPPRSIVITADDGNESIYAEMVPRLKRYGFPATLFIYPSAISNAKWAMTWQQLMELQNNGSFDIQSHTYWHPDFHKDKQRLSPSAYKDDVEWQLRHSKQVLEQKLGRKIDLLAWPFGICDEFLIGEARQAGYRAGFTIERRSVRPADNVFSLPRYIMTNAQQGRTFERFLEQATAAPPMALSMQ